uniref:Uncharacterized protein n=1 Tax=Oryza glumipatula TaxID=40148 RepID=A0A0D9Y844_9ORYZ
MVHASGDASHGIRDEVQHTRWPERASQGHGPSKPENQKMPLLVLIFFLVLGVLYPAAAAKEQFLFNEFTSINLIFDGMVMVTLNGLLMLTNNINKQRPCLVLVPATPVPQDAQ